MREKAIKIKRKRCASDWFLDIFKVVFLVLVTVICVYPFWNIFVVSINDATDALRGGLYFLPRKLSLASYKDILGRATFLHGILITVLRTAIGTPLAVLVTTALQMTIIRRLDLIRCCFPTTADPVVKGAYCNVVFTTPVSICHAALTAFIDKSDLFHHRNAGLASTCHNLSSIIVVK